MNLPNLITVLRILSAPVFYLMLMTHAQKTEPLRWLALVLYVAAIATDGVDGALARKRGLVTKLGTLLDPIADKILIGLALLALAQLQEIPTWAAALILIREFGITIYRMLVLKKRVVAANAGGKAKTILQGITIGFLISPLDYYLDFLQPLQQFALFVTVLVTLWTGATYLREAFATRSSSQAND